MGPFLQFSCYHIYPTIEWIHLKDNSRSQIRMKIKKQTYMSGTSRKSYHKCMWPMKVYNWFPFIIYNKLIWQIIQNISNPPDRLINCSIFEEEKNHCFKFDLVVMTKHFRNFSVHLICSFVKCLSEYFSIWKSHSQNINCCSSKNENHFIFSIQITIDNWVNIIDGAQHRSKFLVMI